LVLVDWFEKVAALEVLLGVLGTLEVFRVGG